MIVDVLPEMTIQELKRQLKDLLRADDESMKAVTMVELLVGETKLTDDQTVVEAGLSEDVVLQVFFTVLRTCSDSGCIFFLNRMLWHLGSGLLWHLGSG